MSYDNNPVYEPQKYGFDEVVGIAELAPPDYSFDYLAVLKNDKGYYIGTDSGCSCPSPWESHTAEDFTGPLTAQQVHEEAMSLLKNSYRAGPEEVADVLKLLKKVR